MNLHLINKTPSHHSTLRALSLINPNDYVIFINDGVYNVIIKTLQPFNKTNATLLCIQNDLTCRGILYIKNNIKIINTKTFVNICLVVKNVLNWL